MAMDILHFSKEFLRGRDDPLGFLMLLSLVKDDLPWLYDLAVDAYQQTTRRSANAKEARQRVFNALKMLLLIIPRRVSQPLALETDPIEVETRLQQELFDALKEISKHEFFDEKSEPEKVKADN